MGAVFMKLSVPIEEALFTEWLLNGRLDDVGNEILSGQCPPERKTGDEEVAGFCQTGSDVIARKSILP
jgi:hypothetical protein